MDPSLGQKAGTEAEAAGRLMLLLGPGAVAGRRILGGLGCKKVSKRLTGIGK